MSNDMISIITCSGTPTLANSPNLYPPGPNINAFTGDATGVENAVEAAMATIITNGYAETDMVSAKPVAIGAMSTAVAVFEIN